MGFLLALTILVPRAVLTVKKSEQTIQSPGADATTDMQLLHVQVHCALCALVAQWIARGFRNGFIIRHQQNRDPGSSQLGVLASRSQLELGTEIAAYSPSWPRASFG